METLTPTGASPWNEKELLLEILRRLSDEAARSNDGLDLCVWSLGHSVHRVLLAKKSLEITDELCTSIVATV